MKKIYSALFAVAMSITAVAQNGNGWCGTLSFEEQIEQRTDITEAQKQELLNERQQMLATANKQALNPKNHKADKKVIPMVFHILHNCGPENVTQQQVHNMIDILNEDYNYQDPGIANVYDEFQDIVADCEMEFRLATTAPDGSCTNGIVYHRIDDPYFTSSQQIEAIKPTINWPVTNYMNVYVVGSIASSGGGRTLGYVVSSGPWHDRDGFVMIYDDMGERGAPNTKTATHEIGHYFSLSHTWGSNNNAGESGSCSTDDGIDDTPNTIGHFSTCPNKTNSSTCGSLDNIRNYMDYSSCSANFTEGQKAVMRANLAQNRSELVSEQNIINTGADYEIGQGPSFVCEADFDACLEASICPGTSISFQDKSFHTVTGRTWTFEGGTPATSTEEAPVITYNTPGVYKVTLEVTDGTNTESLTREDVVVVLDGGALGEQAQEGFETIDLSSSTDWEIDNENGDRTFVVNGNVGKGSSKSLYIQNRRIVSGRTDKLISNTIDLSGASSTEIDFTFDYAYAPKSEDGNNDELNIFISDDCGVTWRQRKSIKGTKLRTSESAVPTGDFVPTEDEWENTTVNMSGQNVAGMRVMFEWISGSGNNFYLDNINITSDAVGIFENTSTVSDLTVFPNPAKGNATVVLDVQDAGSADIVMYDVAGNQVFNQAYEHVSVGEHNMNLNLNGVRPGVYVVKATVDGMVMTQRLIVQ